MGSALVALFTFLAGLALVSAEFPLPATLTALTSSEGQQRLLSSRLRSDFFLLLDHFVTQQDAAFCGPASSAMVLNALDVPRPLLSPASRITNPNEAYYDQDNIFNSITERVISKSQVYQQGMSLQELSAFLSVHPGVVSSFQFSASPAEVSAHAASLSSRQSSDADSHASSSQDSAQSSGGTQEQGSSQGRQAGDVGQPSEKAGSASKQAPAAVTLSPGTMSSSITSGTEASATGSLYSQSGAAGVMYSVDAFRNSIISALGQPDLFVILNFDRAVLKEVGGGHHSPLAAYHEATDSVLVMDVSRYKYTAWWAPVEALFNASSHTVDSSSKLTRGLAFVGKSETYGSTLPLGPVPQGQDNGAPLVLPTGCSPGNDKAVKGNLTSELPSNGFGAESELGGSRKGGVEESGRVAGLSSGGVCGVAFLMLGIGCVGGLLGGFFWERKVRDERIPSYMGGRQLPLAVYCQAGTSEWEISKLLGHGSKKPEKGGREGVESPV